jgi:hypothetical protein
VLRTLASVCATLSRLVVDIIEDHTLRYVAGSSTRVHDRGHPAQQADTGRAFLLEMSNFDNQ